MSEYDRKDAAYHKAKAEGYRSRAAYKLLELEKKHKLFSGKSTKVCDLGCAPGSWLQVTKSKIGPKGRAVGIDIVGVEPFKSDSILLIAGDISSKETREQVLNFLDGKADLLLSDMSEKLSGIYFRDVCRSADLMTLGLDSAEVLLRPGGSFVAKYFPGEETEQIVKQMRKKFKIVKTHVLKSSRNTSREKYVVAKEFTGSTVND